MRIVQYLLILVVVALGIVFAWLNAGAVTLSYFTGTVEMPLALALVAAVIVGWLLGVASVMAMHLRLRRRLAAAERDRRRAEQPAGTSRQADKGRD